LSEQSLYKDVLLEHYRHPHNRGGLEQTDVIRRGSNPRCGDDIEVGIKYEGNRLAQVRFRGRGCSICIASASMMTEAVHGKSREEASQLYKKMKQWFEDKQDTEPEASLRPLAAVRDHSARRRCVMLSWEALEDALEDR
jgi:nitrogen fixation NifU-like protein